jgi:hypothetical protein
MSFVLGARVKIGTKKGVIRFIGETKFAAGEWYGVSLSEPTGKNDGSVNGERYFVCEPSYGIFVKKAQVRLDRSAFPPESSQAKMGEPKKKVEPKTAETAVVPAQEITKPADASFVIGQRVKVGTKEGYVRFFGETKFAAGIWFGVELDAAAGKNDGSVNGDLYFKCLPKHGLFVKKAQLRKVTQGSGAALSSPARVVASLPTVPSLQTPSPTTEMLPASLQTTPPSLVLPPSLSPPPLKPNVKMAEVDAEVAVASKLLIRKEEESFVEKRHSQAVLNQSKLAGNDVVEDTKTAASAKQTEQEMAVLLRSLELSEVERKRLQSALNDAKSAEAEAVEYVRKQAAVEAGVVATEQIKEKKRLQVALEEAKQSEARAVAMARKNAEDVAMVEINALKKALELTQGNIKEEHNGNAAKVISLEVELGKLQRTVKVYEEAKAALETDLAQARAAESSAQNITKTSEMKIVALEAELSRIREKVNQTTLDNTAAITALKAELDEAGKKYHKERVQLQASLEEAKAAGAASLKLAGNEAEEVAAKYASTIVALKEELIQTKIKHEGERKKHQISMDQTKFAEAASIESARKDAEAIAAGEIAALNKALEQTKGDGALAFAVHNEEKKALELRLQQIEEKYQNTRIEMTKVRDQYDELRLELEKSKQQAGRSASDVAKDKAAVFKAERQRDELQKEILELNDVVENLTLDKEQLQAEKDFAEEESEDLKIEVSQLELQMETMKSEFKDREIAQSAVGVESSGQEEHMAQITAQNSKLREALLRLRDSSAVEKADLSNMVKALEKELNSIKSTASNASKLQEQKDKLEVEILELKEMVDTSQAYESIVEDLTEKNLELNDRAVELENNIEELEQLRTISEEVEAQQLEYIEQLASEIKVKDEKIYQQRQEVKNHELLAVGKDATISRFRDAIQSLKTELDHAKFNVKKMQQDMVTQGSGADENLNHSMDLLNLSQAMLRTEIDCEAIKLELALTKRLLSNMEDIVPEELMERSSDVVSCHLLMVSIDSKSDILINLISKHQGDGIAATYALARPRFAIESALIDLQCNMRSLGLIFSGDSDMVKDIIFGMAQRILPTQRRIDTVLDSIIAAFRSDRSLPLTGVVDTLVSVCTMFRQLCYNFLREDDEKIKDEWTDFAPGLNREQIVSHILRLKCTFSYLHVATGNFLTWVLAEVGQAEHDDVILAIGKWENLHVKVQSRLGNTRQFTLEKIDSESTNSLTGHVTTCFEEIRQVLLDLECEDSTILAEKVEKLQDPSSYDWHSVDAAVAAIIDFYDFSASPLHQGVSIADTTSFVYREVPTLKHLNKGIRNRIGNAETLEQSLIGLKASLSKRVQEVNAKQREVDASKVKVKQLEQSLSKAQILQLDTEKHRLTIQADFEREQANFEKAMADVHKDVERLERESRRSKKAMQRGGIDASSSSLPLSPMTPNGGTVSNNGKGVSNTRVLAEAVRKSFMWRKEVVRHKLEGVKKIKLGTTPNYNVEHRRQLGEYVCQLDRLDCDSRLQQSKRRLVDLTVATTNPRTYVERSRAEDLALVMKFEKCKSALMAFIRSEYIGVVTTDLTHSDDGPSGFHISTNISKLSNFLLKP